MAGEECSSDEVTDRDKAELKELARHLCTVDGNNPDSLVTLLMPTHGMGLLRAYRLADQEMGGWVPAWCAYAGLAQAALEKVGHRAAPVSDEARMLVQDAKIRGGGIR